MDLTEQDVYTAFGMAPPAPAVEPADQTSTSQDSSTAQTAVQTDTQQTDGQKPDGQGEEQTAEQSHDQPESKPEQSVEERRANAARRRAQERREAIEHAVAAERDRVYRELGYNGEQDYRARRSQEQADLRARALKRMGLTEEEGTALFGLATEANGPTAENSAPEYADVPDDVADGGAEDEPFVGGEEALQRQLAEISKLDPNIRTLADLQAKPWAPQMAEALNARQFGTDEDRLVRAFKVFAQDDIIQARLDDARKAGRQEALNQQAGKEHLAPARERTGAGLPDLPRETLAAYKQLFPGLTYEQYQQKYDKAMKATT